MQCVEQFDFADLVSMGNRAGHSLLLFVRNSLSGIACIGLAACSGDNATSAGSGSLETGTAGSTARMVIDGDYLYAISGSTVQLFDISAPATPLPWTQVTIDWDIQTLFPYENYLLVGAADGVHILDNSIPASPQLVGDFQHALAQDPVVAQDGVAYVTLKRDDTMVPNGIVNQLNVIDISDVTQPALVQTQPMQGPSGLSVTGDRLYVCDGVAGIKIFSLADKFNPVPQQSIPNVDCSDVIARNDKLYVIDDRGFSQYDTLTPGIPQLLSTVDSEPVIYLVDR